MILLREVLFIMHTGRKAHMGRSPLATYFNLTLNNTINMYKQLKLTTNNTKKHNKSLCWAAHTTMSL